MRFESGDATTTFPFIPSRRHYVLPCRELTIRAIRRSTSVNSIADSPVTVTCDRGRGVRANVIRDAFWNAVESGLTGTEISTAARPMH